MDNVDIVVHKRDVTGTRASKRLRKEGLIPGVIYGHGKEAVLIAVEPHALRDALSTAAGTHAILNVTFEGQKRGHKAIVKEMTLDRVKSNVIHVDLQEIRLDETIETTVSIRFEGESRGVKAGGLLEEAVREVTVKGVVTEIPEHLVMDITELDVNSTLKVADLQVPEGIEVLADPEDVLCSVLPPRKVVEEVEGEEAPEAAEGAAEPELVGKKEEEAAEG
jgi:large subunit ribosomal protein L25